MPVLTGVEVCARIRQVRTPTPPHIILLTARTNNLDLVAGLTAGASDYIRKPFSQRLLIERIRAILRRAEGRAAAPNSDKVMVRGKLVMDPGRHSCTWDDQPVTLTVTEFLILQALATRPGHVKTRDQLMDAAYDDQVYVDDRTIDSHIKRLRKKFREAEEKT